MPTGCGCGLIVFVALFALAWCQARAAARGDQMAQHYFDDDDDDGDDSIGLPDQW